ncbi:MAG TPA: FlgD immunoglobulin-like domain containing protein, partial [bacterium]|nr:FlgD immunoglobulin-like domain containing protein [bacterium]
TSSVLPYFSWTAVTDTGAGFAYYRFELDTDGVWATSFRSETMTATSCTPQINLTPGTWVWHVKAIDRAGNVSAFTDSAFRVTASDFTPALDLTPYLEAQGGGLYRARVFWAASPDTRVTRYHLYYELDADGSDTLNHADTTVFSVYVNAPDTSWLTPFVLTSDTRYVFALRVGDTYSEEKNCDVQASIYVPKTTVTDTGTAYIQTPGSGQSILGSDVTVAAELVGIDPATVAYVTFQYRRVGDTVWHDIISSSDMPNPDRTAPFYIHWNVDGLLQTGAYSLRTMVTYLTGGTVEQPIYKTVTFGDTVNPEIRESDSNAAHVKEQLVYATTLTTIYFGDEEKDFLTRLMVPAGAIDDSQTYLRVEHFTDLARYGDSVPLNTFGTVGEFRSFSLANGDTQFPAGREIQLWFPYRDANNDGVVDDTLLFERELKLYWYNDRTRAWELVPNQTLDMDNNIIHAHLTHFSTYALFGPAAAPNLDQVTVYPNPFRPNDNNADNGVAYQPGNLNSNIIFDNVSANVTIEIYDISGRRVAKMEAYNQTRNVQWDVCDEDGRAVASGVYIYVITDRNGNRRVGKVAVIR